MLSGESIRHLPVLELAFVLARIIVVPLDPGDPPPRIACILEDARVSLVVAGEGAGRDKARLAVSHLLISQRAAAAALTSQASDTGTIGCGLGVQWNGPVRILTVGELLAAVTPSTQAAVPASIVNPKPLTLPPPPKRPCPPNLHVATPP
eukprot:jgi/Mesvir1/4939/Mv04564-RA.1